jgi:cysteine synthase
LDTIDDLILSGSSQTLVEKTFADTGYTASNMEFVVVDTTGGNTTINLPVLASSQNFTIGVSKDDPSSNKVIVNANGADLINNSGSYDMVRDDESVTLRGGVSKWSIW